MSKRTLTLNIGHAYGSKGWSTASLVVQNGDKKAIIQIRDPWDLRHLREQLDVIEEGWKQAMEDLTRR